MYTKKIFSSFVFGLAFISYFGIVAPAFAQTTTAIAQPDAPPVIPHKLRTAKLVLGDTDIAFFSKATRVEVFQIRLPRQFPEFTMPKIDNYLLVSQGKTQGKWFASRLAACLQDDHLYQGSGSLCFNPRVAFRVWNGNVYADVAICFHCQKFSIHFSDGRPNVYASTWNYSHPSLVDLAKIALPDDLEVQSLPSVIIKDSRDSLPNPVPSAAGK